MNRSVEEIEYDDEGRVVKRTVTNLEDYDLADESKVEQPATGTEKLETK